MATTKQFLDSLEEVMGRIAVGERHQVFEDALALQEAQEFTPSTPTLGRGSRGHRKDES